MLVNNLTHLETQAAILSRKLVGITDEKDFQKCAKYIQGSSSVFRRSRILGLSALAFGLVLLTLPLRAAEFVYVTNEGENNVWAYRIAINGALTPIPGSPFGAGSQPNSVAVDPTAKFVYVTNGNDDTISAYRINKNGALTPIPRSPFAAGRNPVSVAVDPRGEFVYVANSSTISTMGVSAYRINKNGALTPIPGSPASGFLPEAVAVDPRGEFVYVANRNTFLGLPSVSAYNIGSNGALTPIDPLSGPFDDNRLVLSVAIDPRGKFVYVPDVQVVYAYSIGTNGALTPLPGSPFPAVGGLIGFQGNSVEVDPTGKFVYVANKQENNVWAYSIGTNGALTPLPGSPFPAGPYPLSVALDPTGKFVYVANESDNTVWTYRIARNGALTNIPGLTVVAGFDRIGTNLNGYPRSTSVAISRSENDD